MRLKMIFAVAAATLTMSVSAAVTVGSLDELAANLKKSNVELKMNSGSYRITAADVAANKYGQTIEVVKGEKSNALLLIEGNNNIYDFADAKIEVESSDATPLQIYITGSGNIVKNLSLEGANIVIDGANNRIEGAMLISSSSAAEDASVIVVRGDNNQVKGCKITLRAKLHAISIAGAKNPTIEGCNIEGAMSTSEGYTISTVGDGIRTCAEGNTIIGGERFSRRKTSGKVMVVGCTVKNSRRGIDLFLGDGSRYVESCTLVGCQEGYSVNNGGIIVNCKADSAFGPALWVEGGATTNVTADITLTPYAGEMYEGNKSGHVVFIQGLGHKITLKADSSLSVVQGQKIAIGGDCKTLAYSAKVDDLPAANMTFTNETDYPVIIGQNTSYNTIITSGDVEGNTYDNTIEDL